jgi:hypothetical protein
MDDNLQKPEGSKEKNRPQETLLPALLPPRY